MWHIIFSLLVILFVVDARSADIKVKCPSEGYVPFKEDGFCLQLNTRALPWISAYKACRDNGGYLVDLQNRNKKLAAIRKLPITFSNTVEYWIGGSDLDKMEEWTWLDHSSITLDEGWLEERPNEQGYCLGLKTPNLSSMDMVDADCNAQKYFICEQKGYWDTPAPTPETPVKCPTEGYVPFKEEGFCLQFNTRALPWISAYKTCRDNGGYLVNLKNGHEKLAAIRELPIGFTSNQQYWIGGSDLDKLDEWKWLDDTSIWMNEGWVEERPNGQGSCLGLKTPNPSSMEMIDDDCNVQKYFICEQKGYWDTPAPTPPAPVKCPTEGYVPFKEEGFCLQFNTRASHWLNAYKTCRDNGGYLVDLQDRYTKLAAIRELPIEFKSNSQYWTVGSDLNRLYKFTWSNNTPIGINEGWYSGQPVGRGHCVCLKTPNPSAMQIADEDCLVQSNFICQQKGSWVVQTTTPPPKVTCSGEGYVPFLYSGLCLKLVKKASKWENAKTSCKDSGGALISLKDNRFKRLAAIRELDISVSASSAYWIGGSLYNTKWLWVDESAINMKEGWLTRRPNNTGSCLSLTVTNPSYMTMADDNCDGGKYFICEQKGDWKIPGK